MFEKVDALFFSPTKTTEQVVTTLSHEFNKPVRKLNVTSKVNREKPYSFNPNNLAIIGVPVYAGRIPKIMETYFKTLEGNNIPTVIITLYGNRDYDDALLEMRDLLNDQNFNVIAAGAFIGQHSYTRKVANNRPDAKDLEVVIAFSKDIIKKLKKNTQDELLSVKGNYPYRERKSRKAFAPVTSNMCIHCGLCAKDCPVQVIDYDDVSKIDANNCLHCCRCIQVCPTQAKKFDHSFIKGLVNQLINNCGDIRKEPQLFL
ncbi:MAG TPA: EFR1 family ferrodoxin [Clostridia bacterium]|nr:EFR1 family ferrodoxin [Clostridia bacterium]